MVKKVSTRLPGIFAELWFTSESSPHLLVYNSHSKYMNSNNDDDTIDSITGISDQT